MAPPPATNMPPSPSSFSLLFCAVVRPCRLRNPLSGYRLRAPPVLRPPGARAPHHYGRRESAKLRLPRSSPTPSNRHGCSTLAALLLLRLRGPQRQVFVVGVI